MGDIFSTALGNVLGEIIVAIAGLFVTGIGTVGAFYLRKLDSNLKKKDLRDEINRYVEFAKKSKSFSLMTTEEKTQTVFEKARSYADESQIKISDRELLILVEGSMGTFDSLESIGLRVMKISRTNNLQGEDIR